MRQAESECHGALQSEGAEEPSSGKRRRTAPGGLAGRSDGEPAEENGGSEPSDSDESAESEPCDDGTSLSESDGASDSSGVFHVAVDPCKGWTTQEDNVFRDVKLMTERMRPQPTLPP